MGMEVLTDAVGYIVSLPYLDLEQLLKCDLEAEILLSNDAPPYNHPTGKKLRLCLDREAEERVGVKYHPADCDWDSLEVLVVTVNESAYKQIYYAGGVMLPDFNANQNLIIRDEGAATFPSFPVNPDLPMPDEVFA